MSDNLAPPFVHPKNIVHGAARVIYVNGHGVEPSGWHLPGLRITDDPAEAERVARVINELTIDNAGYVGTGFVGRSTRA